MKPRDMKMEVTVKIKGVRRSKVGLFLIGVIAMLFRIKVEADVTVKEA